MCPCSFIHTWSIQHTSRTSFMDSDDQLGMSSLLTGSLLALEQLSWCMRISARVYVTRNKTQDLRDGSPSKGTGHHTWRYEFDLWGLHVGSNQPTCCPLTSTQALAFIPTNTQFYLSFFFKDCTSLLGTYWQKHSWWHPEWVDPHDISQKDRAFKSSQSKSDFIQARTYLAYVKLVSDRPVPPCQVLVTEVNHWRENQCYSGQLWQLWMKTAMVRSSRNHD